MKKLTNDKTIRTFAIFITGSLALEALCLLIAIIFGTAAGTLTGREDAFDITIKTLFQDHRTELLTALGILIIPSLIGLIARAFEILSARERS